MKTIAKYALLVAVAIIGAVQFTACKQSDDAAIEDVVNELKKTKEFKTVEYDGTNIVAEMEVGKTEAAQMESVIKQFGKEQIEETMKAAMVQQLKASDDLTGKDKSQVEALVNKKCGLQLKIKVGSETLDVTIPSDEFAKLLEK
ncbi:MAG: hypothetical protein K2I56_03890 [Muribaculaceae bacterium]|nr:hypothetical protein [Muribaculaceae bacterium]